VADCRKTGRAVLAWLCFVLIPAGVCMANPMAFDPVEIIRKGLMTILFILGVDFAVDGAVLALSYGVLKKGGLIFSRDFLAHTGWVFVAGLAIDLLLFAAVGSTVAAGTSVGLWVLIGFASLLAVNYLICRLTEGFKRREALLTGVLLGIFTNPVLFELMAKALDMRSEPVLLSVIR
jgi:hypothetical protein